MAASSSLRFGLAVPWRSLALTGAIALATSAAHAATGWDEAVQGDLANSGLAPTPMLLQPGANLVAGTTGRTAGVVDRDYFTFTLAAGQVLGAIVVLPGTTSLGISELSFIAAQSGPQVTVNPTGGSAAGLLGYWHFGPNDIGGDILGVMGIAPGAIGFESPLPTGTYAFWIQDTGTGTAAYRLAFDVTVVPEPGTWALMLAGGAVLVGARKRRGSQAEVPRRMATSDSTTF
jgi:hypothetical protein